MSISSRQWVILTAVRDRVLTSPLLATVMTESESLELGKHGLEELHKQLSHKGSVAARTELNPRTGSRQTRIAVVGQVKPTQVHTSSSRAPINMPGTGITVTTSPITKSPALSQLSLPVASFWKFLESWTVEFAMILLEKPPGHAVNFNVTESLSYGVAIQYGWTPPPGVIEDGLTPATNIVRCYTENDGYDNCRDIVFHGGCKDGERINRGGSVHQSVRINPRTRLLECVREECVGTFRYLNKDVKFPALCEHIEQFVVDSGAIRAYELFGYRHKSKVLIPIIKGAVNLEAWIARNEDGDVEVRHFFQLDDAVKVSVCSEYGDNLRMFVNTILDKYRTSGPLVQFKMATEVERLCSKYFDGGHDVYYNFILKAASKMLGLTEEEHLLAQAISYMQHGICWVCKWSGDNGVALH